MCLRKDYSINTNIQKHNRMITSKLNQTRILMTKYIAITGLWSNNHIVELNIVELNTVAQGFFFKVIVVYLRI